MVDIDYIMDLLDWNNSPEMQRQGIELAKSVKCLNAFIQPGNRYYGKNVWENCARIISERTDDELEPYIINLMQWLQDMNWPGAFCILERLKKLKSDALFSYSYEICMKCAEALEDETWKSNLQLL